MPDPADVDYHLDRAQAMLEIAGAPSTPSEALIHAQTNAIVGLLLYMRWRDQPAARQDPPWTTPMGRGVPIEILSALPNGLSPERVALGMTYVAVDPNWQSNKILAIKTLRSHAKCGLREAKDLIELSIKFAQAYGHNWWE